MTTDNRTNEPNQNETKSGQGFCFTEAQVEAAAKALHEFETGLAKDYWGFVFEAERRMWRDKARVALTAAGVAPQPVIDEAALAEVIGKVTDLWDEPLDEVHDIPQIARAVAAWLKDGAR